ncbi:TadE/TadG family type IV pilus assembly protein [Streptomyces sp. NPDC127114]|uniref:TadE/TadG family type IV pilus assembly protein n=1 Tax=Streptomyces sp. NPDC127114 TaxID=3345366 RepID=UPI00363462B4
MRASPWRGEREREERHPGERGPGERGPAERGPGERGSAERGPGERAGDSGQVAVEFVGMLPLILLTLVLLWQCVLIGYTYTLAGNAADQAARAGAVGDDCAAAGKRHLEGAWASNADAGCDRGADGLVRARVTLRVPVLFPGAVSFPWQVDGEAAAVWEGDER